MKLIPLLTILSVVTLLALAASRQPSSGPERPRQVENEIRQTSPALAQKCLSPGGPASGLPHAEAASSSILTPRFPTRYSDGTQVRAQGMTVTLQPLGSKPAPAETENGKIVYHSAYPSTDSLQVVTPGRSEEFLLLHDAHAPTRFDHQLTGVQGVRDITLQNGAIHFKNAHGQELQIETPWLIQSSPVGTTLFFVFPGFVCQELLAVNMPVPNGIKISEV
jgi:hypothetical protein